MQYPTYLRAAVCCVFLFSALPAASQSSIPSGATPNWVATPLAPPPTASTRLTPLIFSATSQSIVYADTSLTACPAGQKLLYFFYYQDRPDFRGTSWCGAAQADLDWANATDPNRWRIPYLLESCTPGVSWSYSHAFRDGTRYYSPLYRGISMVCTTQPDPPPPPPLGCATGEGGFTACPPNTGSPLQDPPVAPPGTPEGAGPGPNDGPPGEPWSPDPVGDPAPDPVFDPPPTDERGNPVSDDGTSCTAGQPPPRVEAAGNPIFAGTGNKYQEEVDYRSPDGLNFVRRYNSSLPGWVHNYGVRVFANATLARVVRPDGRAHVFAGNSAGEWSGETAVRERLFKLSPGDPAQPLWKYVTANNSIEWYDAQGRVVSITRRGGRSYTVDQRDGLMRGIRDTFGRGLVFAYDAQNRLSSVTTPEGTSIAYGYDTQGRLAQVSYPDGTTRSYLYENSSYPLALTGLVDERGVRFATWTYDGAGRAIGSEHAGGVQHFQLTFNANGSTVVTDPLGTSRTQFYVSAGARKVFGGQSQPCAGCVRDAASTVVDPASGMLSQSIDYLGVATLFTNDTQRKLPLGVTQAAGRPEQRQRGVEWSPNFRLPILITQAGRTTAFTYDVLGNKLSETVTDLATRSARTWQWTYTSQGLVASMTDPKGAVWSYGYDNAGNRVSVKNPIGQLTSYGYDTAGRVTSRTEPNGLVTAYTYDARGRLTGQVRGGEATNFSYAPTGQIATALLPNGYQVSYSYDAAQRLIGATDNRGASIRYTLDAASNRVREEVRDAAGAIALATGRIVNSLNQVAAIQGSLGQTTALAYDANGEPVAQTDPLNQTTRQTLDGLRRPVATTFADNVSATKAWSQLDQLTQVTDAKGVATGYQTNAFGEVVQESSPDIGTMAYQRNAAGEVIGIADAVGNTTAIARDPLGRPTTVQYAPDQLAAFRYDQGQAGYLSKIEDKSGATTYERDAQGRILTKTQAVNDNQNNPSRFKVQYGYTGGDLSSITYPSGLKVFYRRAAGRIIGIDVQEPGVNPLQSRPAVPFVSNLAHTALGQPKAWAWANGDSAARTYDTDGRMTANEFASYSYDAAGRITGVTQKLWAKASGDNDDQWQGQHGDEENGKNDGKHVAGSPFPVPVQWTAGYDSRNRLTSLARAGASAVYTYDPNSNRLTSINKVTSDTDLDGLFDADGFAQTTQTTTQKLYIDAASNRLLGFSQSLTQARGSRSATSTSRIQYSIDANGAMTSDGLRTFEYDASRRLSKVRMRRDGDAATVSYLHNALGQRVFKSEPQSEHSRPDEATMGTGFIAWLHKNFQWMFAPGRSSSVGTAYIYDENATLLGEYDNGSSAGKGRQEYIWLPTDDGQAIPVGISRNGKTYAVHADHLGTPRLITDESNNPVWQWPYSAFGNNKPTGVLKATLNAKAPITNQPMLKATEPGIEANLRFPGQYFDEESNLSYNYFRSYQPTQGRYTQPDPIGLAGGLNRFAYVDGNSLSFVDPTGLICEYSQSTGSFVCRNAGGQTYASCTGYAGKGQGLDNPAAQNQRNVGPIPQGTYTVGGFTTRRGANTRPLTPDPSNHMYGRAGFLLHGDNAARNNTASEGCIIIPPQCRTAVPAGETLVVRP